MATLPVELPVNVKTRPNGAMALVVTRATFGSEVDDVLYWRETTVVERLAALEVLRRRTIEGEGEARSGLQRVCRVVRR